MKILMYGVSHETVSQNDIHRYFLDEETKRKHLNDIIQFSGVHELVLVTSPYRNEYYLHVDEKTFKHGDLLRYLAEYTKKTLNEIILETYSKFNSDVISHLYNLSSGIDSYSETTPEAISMAENSLLFAIENNTVGSVLFNLFNKAVECVLKVQADSGLVPLRKGEFSTVLNAVHSASPDITGKNIVLIGHSSQAPYLAKQLLFMGAQTVSIVTESKEVKERIQNSLRHCNILPSVSKLTKDLHIVEYGESSYRLSSSDIAVILPTEPSQPFYPIIESIDEMRLTKKKQLVIDLSITGNQVIKLDNSVIYYLDGSKFKQKNFTNEDIEHAAALFDEALEFETKKFMEFYTAVTEKKTTAESL